MESSMGKWLILCLFFISCFATKRAASLFDFKDTNIWKGKTGNTEVSFQVNEVQGIWFTGIITLTSETGSRKYGIKGFQKGNIYPCRIVVEGDDGEASIFINGRQTFDSIMLETGGWESLPKDTAVVLQKFTKSHSIHQ
ncbi:MAG: hypothetical protein IPN29_20440 [Saprospiraceae bacterium]|nr:hypothetical protein [Saprospiraceae bacterium]